MTARCVPALQSMRLAFSSTQRAVQVSEAGMVKARPPPEGRSAPADDLWLLLPLMPPAPHSAQSRSGRRSSPNTCAAPSQPALFGEGRVVEVIDRHLQARGDVIAHHLQPAELLGM